MPLTDLSDWLDEYSRSDVVWFVKRLTANDTLATKSNQAGPYTPKAFTFRMFPGMDTTERKNPDAWFNAYVDSHADFKRVRAVYYNNRPRGEGTRNETRLTNFGGQKSALLDPESTGALTVFAFVLNEQGAAAEVHIWVSRHPTEEDLIEDRVGPVEPGKYVTWDVGSGIRPHHLAKPLDVCRLAPHQIPPAWLQKFPSGEEIIRKAIELREDALAKPDARLLRRRECEYELFQSVEEAFHLPRVIQGFDSISSFVGLAQSILQSRKTRAGNSLELHAREILVEEGLRPGHEFQHKPVIENGKRPDFVFPSQAAYEDKSFPDSRLRILAAKTTCKDRWRQILNEADRVKTKHLLTLQEGVSEGQFREMKTYGVQLVVPLKLHDKFPKAVRPHLSTLEEFIAEARLAAIGP